MRIIERGVLSVVRVVIAVGAGCHSMTRSDTLYEVRISRADL